MSDRLLVLNVGSSSIKFAVHDAEGAQAGALLRGQITGIGTHPALHHSGVGLDTQAFGPLAPSDRQDELTERLLGWLSAEAVLGRIVAVGHRVVHGGTVHSEPTVVDADVLASLSSLEPLAPLHQPYNVAAIRAVARRFPDLLQVACFDTGFHRDQDSVAQEFALPRALTDRGIRRYGFHGLSYEYIAGQLPARLGDRADGRVIVAHLGNGASMCAMRKRRSVATTMGFTALDGLVMAERCGSLDPGVILYLLQEAGLSVQEVEGVLYRKSGLLGVSGISGDMELLEQSVDPRADHAIDLFCYRAVTALSALVGALGGLDALVFTAGIGENSARVRRQICERLDWLGIELDHAANASHETKISADAARCPVFVIPTDEESVIAEATRRLASG